MSKSIYEEALKNANNIIGTTTEVVKDLNKIREALEQAQKQEKLLGLHKTLIEEDKHLNSILKDYNNNNKNYSDHDLGQIQSWAINTEKRIETIKKQIKELEVLLK